MIFRVHRNSSSLQQYFINKSISYPRNQEKSLDYFWILMHNNVIRVLGMNVIYEYACMGTSLPIKTRKPSTLWMSQYIPRIMHTVRTILWMILLPFLLWRHNGRDGVSNHQHHECLLNRSSRHSSKKTSKLRVTGVCAETSPAKPANSPHKWPVTRKMFPFGDVMFFKMPECHWSNSELLG